MTESGKRDVKISVIMSAYNAADYIETSVQSLLVQTYADFELIVIDDCSKDATGEILEKFAKNDPRIILIKNDVNEGLTKNLNKAFRHSNGKYIARMDSDDIARRDRLEKQAKYLDMHTDIDICGSWAYRIDEKGFGHIKLKPKVNEHEIKARLVCGNFIIHPSVMMRREVLKKTPYDENYRTVQDYKLWIDCWDMRFHNIPECLMYYRDNIKGISRTERKKVADRLAVLEMAYGALFEKIGIKITDDERKIFVKCMHNMTKFENSIESEYALEVCRSIAEKYPGIDKKCMYSRWARGHATLPSLRNIGIWMEGYMYWYIEAFGMLLKPWDLVPANRNKVAENRKRAETL